jgi:Raf kinase inhibitor-like YbhB/YbcL family protein
VLAEHRLVDAATTHADRPRHVARTLIATPFRCWEHRPMSGRPPNPYEFLPPLPAFSLRSIDVREAEPMPLDHVSSWRGAGGKDISPQLSWAGFPATTRSFVLTCLDPDAQSGSGFWHWAVANIPLSTTELPTGAGEPSGRLLPQGATQLRCDAGFPGYAGAAPPPEQPAHRYIFVIHALGAERLELPETASPAFLGLTLLEYALARASLTPIYGR